jgi:hypothetical protein
VRVTPRAKKYLNAPALEKSQKMTLEESQNGRLASLASALANTSVSKTPMTAPDDHASEVIDALDVSTINRLLQDAMQAERTLHRELFDTVVKKVDKVVDRLVVVQKSVAVLGSVQSGSTRLHSDILDMSALANVVSDQVKNAPHPASLSVWEMLI